MEKRLFFFTNSYPFSYNEPFIENEIIYLSDKFKSIEIIPLLGCKNKQMLNPPSNCIIHPPIIKNRVQQYGKGILGFKSLPLYFKDIITNRAFKSFDKLKRAFISFCITNNILHSKHCKEIISRIDNNDIMYFYWGNGLSNILPFIKRLGSKKIVRFHGGDLYDYRSKGYLPIQKDIVSSADICSFISKDGESYLLNRFNDIYFKTSVNYLGTLDHGVSLKSNDHVFRLLSCSNVIPLKRVFLIYEALQEIDNIQIIWTHIGGGSEFNSLKEIVKSSRENIKVNLIGRITNNEVIEYYKNSIIDGFINVSQYEGLPVSIMEATSFDVPVIGTDVGGTSEIVNSKTGVLLNSNPTINEVKQAILKLSNGIYEPKLFWKSMFSAEKNYKVFIQSTLLSKKSNS